MVARVFRVIVSLASSSCKYRSFVLTQRGWKHTAGHVREDQTILSERQREDDPDLHLSVSISH